MSRWKGSYTDMKQGYSLKKRSLKRWIYEHGYTQPYMAEQLGMETDDFKRKLREHEQFDKYQIRLLVDFMKAEAAFMVLYFPSASMRRQVYREVFG